MTLFCRKYSRNQAGIVVSFWHKTVRNCAECLVVQRLCAASDEKNSTDCQKEVMVIFYEHVGQDSFFYEDRDIFFPAHIHRQLEIFYLLEGETEIRLDQKRFLMHSGELLCVFPNQIHSYESHGSTRFYIGLLNPAELRENGALFTKHRCLIPVLPISDFQEHYREKITQEQVAGLWESAVLHCPGCLQKRWSVLFWIILTVSG